MQRIKFLVVCFLLSSVCGYSSTLSSNTPIKIRLLENIQSGSSRSGTTIKFEVDESITDSSGNVLIEKCTPAVGTVRTSKKRGFFGSRGALEFSIDSTKLVDGQKIPLRAFRKEVGRGNYR